MTLRSGVLGVGIFNNGNFVVFTVPAGETWLLKDVRIENAGGAPTNVVVYASDPTSGTLAVLYRNATLAALSEGSFVGWFVLVAGQQLLIGCGPQNVHVWASGAKLLGVV